MKKLQFLAVLFAVSIPLAFSGCGKAKKTVKTYDDDYIIAKVDDKSSIDYATAYTYVKILQAEAYSYTKNIIDSTNSANTEIWSTKLNDDSGYDTYGDQFKGDALDSIKDLLLCQAHSSDYDIEFSDDDSAKCDETASKFIENTGDKTVAAMHADKESVSELLKLLTIENRVKDQVEKDVDTEVSNDDAGQSTFSYVKITKKDNKNPGKLAKKIIKNTDKGTDFATAVSDEGLASTDVSFTTTIPEYDTYGKEMLKHALDMKDGECSSYEDSNKNVIVMYMKAVNDSDATESKKTEIIEKRKSDAYDAKLKEWEDENGVDIDKKAWESISVDDENIFKSKESEETTTLDSGDSSVSVDASLSDKNDSAEGEDK